MWDLVGTASYMAHGFCLLWQPWLVALYAGSDFLIFLAYALIPIALFRLVRLRGDLSHYRGLILLFAAFILLCGLSHLVSMVTLWVPVYALHGAIKLVTATVSLMTAAVLFPLLPRLVAIPSPATLETANARLRQEIAAHESTLADLRAAHALLEQRVTDRTAELSRANDRLNLVMRETSHRKKNLLAVVQSLAAQTARHARDMPDFLDRFSARLAAVSGAIDAVLRHDAGASSDLRRVAEGQLAPWLASFPGRIRLSGDPVALHEDAAQQLALAIHELLTNALKHGALSRPDGTVDLSWRRDAAPDGPRLILEWAERGTAAPPAPTDRNGFGSTLLLTALPAQMAGTAARDFGPDGMTYRLNVPADRL